MWAVIVEEAVPPEMMGLAEVPAPHAAAGEVRVCAVAAGVQTVSRSSDG